VLFDRFEASVDLALIQASAGKVIAPEMRLILALVIFDGFLLFPSAQERAQPAEHRFNNSLFC